MSNKIRGYINDINILLLHFLLQCYCAAIHAKYLVFTYFLTYLITYLLTPWSRVHLEELTVSKLVKKFPHFMKPEVSLQHSQMPTTCPYPEPHRSSPYPHIPLPGFRSCAITFQTFLLQVTPYSTKTRSALLPPRDLCLAKLTAPDVIIELYFVTKILQLLITQFSPSLNFLLLLLLFLLLLL